MTFSEIRQLLLEMNDLREQVHSLLTWERAGKAPLYQALEEKRRRIEEAADGFVVWYLEADKTYALVPTEAK